MKISQKTTANEKTPYVHTSSLTHPQHTHTFYHHKNQPCMYELYLKRVMVHMSTIIPPKPLNDAILCRSLYSHALEHIINVATIYVYISDLSYSVKHKCII